MKELIKKAIDNCKIVRYKDHFVKVCLEYERLLNEQKTLNLTPLDKFIENMTEEDIQRLMEPKVVSPDMIETEMDNRGLVLAWDRMIGRTMADWMRKQLTGE
jgi:hypothetical protein